MAKEILLKWDTSELRVDEDEFELVVMMLRDAGWRPNDTKTQVQVARDLMNQGYERSRAMRLAHMAAGELQGFVRRF
jgi:SOS response regulatory protein OraA/RecX